RLKMQSRSPQDVILTYLGDQPIGYCWTIIKADENANGKDSKGLIHMLGVDPDYRQQDIGKAVLRNGLEGLKARGIDIVRLMVDNENAVARSLYESVGFEIYAKTEWYEKALN
ncbi:MAG: N-acetyltransferase, partial [Desulfobacterales bacterium]